MKFVRDSIVIFLLALGLASCGGDSGSASPAATPVRTPQLFASLTATDYTAVVQQLYISYFGRAADTGGLANFTASLAGMGAPSDIQGLSAAYATSPAVRALIDSFGNSAESQALYSGGNDAFVTAIYNNVLSRAPDAEGQAFWVGAINSGNLTRANASLSIMAGALKNSSAQGLLDAQLINKRVTIGTNFTAALVSQNQGGAYSGNTAAAAVRSMLATVTANTDPAAFQATINATINSLAANSPFAQVQGIINLRCLSCHSGGNAQLGIALDSPEQIHALAPDIYQQVVVLRTMPYQNQTQMTNAERAVVAAWFQGGAQ